MASASRSPTPDVQNENNALLPIPVSANVNMPLLIPQNVELTSNVVNTQEINPNAGFFNSSSFSNCTFNFTKCQYGRMAPVYCLGIIVLNLLKGGEI